MIDPDFGIIGPTPRDGSCTVLVSISGLEMLHNVRPEQLRDLIATRCKVAEDTLYNAIGKHLGWETP